jgi:hypothetical protein
MGPRSSNYGIEIHSEVVEHSKNAIETWKHSSGRESPQIHILHGNALNVDATCGESAVGFDRIYVGAAVERRHLSKLTKLLRPGGILVGPVDDELVKVVKICSTRDGNDLEDFTQQVLSGVRFASLLQYPKLETIIPSTVWSPSVHNYYPDSFRASCKEILLCSNSEYVQPRQAVPERKINLAATLPPVLWLEIMSYTHRSWFEPAQSETAFLRQRLLEEQADAQRAHQGRLEAEARLHAVERERDVYRLLAHRWQARLQTLLRERGGNAASLANEEDDTVAAGQTDMETALDTILSETVGRQAIVVSATLRRFHAESESEEEEDHGSEMEEDDHDMQEAVAADDDNASSDDINGGRSRRAYSVTMEDVDSDESDVMASSTTGSAMSLASRPQVRTVSISSEDL